jgi:hypothetical protein
VTQFTDLAQRNLLPIELKERIDQRRLFRARFFEYACAFNDVDHRVTKPKYPGRTVRSSG